MAETSLYKLVIVSLNQLFIFNLLFDFGFCEAVDKSKPFIYCSGINAQRPYKLSHFPKPQILDEHKKLCDRNKPKAVKMPHVSEHECNSHA